MRSVGIWAPSSPADPQNIEDGLEILSRSGVAFRIPKETRLEMCRSESASRKFLAGPDASKITALKKLWDDPDIIDIFGVRGGYGCLRLLPLLDKIKLPHKTKRVWGFSDLTIIQHYFHNRFGLSWVHAPMITGPYFRTPLPQEKKMWQKILSGCDDQESLHKIKAIFKPSDQMLISGKSYLLLGGNLACLTAMIGTPWEPTPSKSFLLFIEDLNEPAYRIDRLLQQLGASKMMKRCVGVLLGHFTDCPGSQGVIKLWAKESNLALFGGLKAGHEAPNIPLVMGESVRLEAKKSGATYLRVPFPHLGDKFI